MTDRAFVPAEPARTSRITGRDGTSIVVYEWGASKGPALLFIHGIYQSALNWHHQFSDPALTEQCRVVALDLRGHGASDKPNGAAFYREPQRWADDIAAIIEHLALDRPILVGWSYGGRVIGDYLSCHGDSLIGGLILIGARMASGIAGEERTSAAVTEASDNARSDIPLRFIMGTRQFTRLCFEREPPLKEIEALAMNSMQTPLYVRRQLVGRPLDYASLLARINVPTLVIHGRKDCIVPLAVGEFSASAIPKATLSVFEHSGHSPFAEEPERFNKLIARFSGAASQFAAQLGRANAIHLL